MPPSPVPHQPLLNKVPEVTLSFWAIKILSTTVGETAADHLAVHVGLGTLVTCLITLSLLGIALIAQVRARAFVPWLYWSTVVLVSVVGTQITDVMTDGLEVSLYSSSLLFTVLLAGAFGAWFYRERTLSIQSIVTRRREIFYWTVVLCTFALGTAAGDLTTEAVGLGFRNGVLIFGAILAVVATAHRLGANPLWCFWVVYILTRPLGASLGDLMSQARTYGGLGLGTQTASLLFLAAILVLVGLQTMARARNASHR